METFEIKYFLAVAEIENIHRASETLGISPGSLSKAISRLEAELGVKLFSREGRNIKLTDHGILLRKKGSQIIQLEEGTRLEISGHLGSIKVVFAGPEILLFKFAVPFSEVIRKRFPKSTFEYRAVDEDVALQKVEQGEAHLGIVTKDIPKSMVSKVLGSSNFQTCVGHDHKLYREARAGKVLSIERVLEYDFVSPSHPILGAMGIKQSTDGWRDDQFPRKVSYLTSSLRTLEEITTTGKAIAYLPDYFIEHAGLEVLKISGCPYSCSQKIKLVARNSKEVGWLNQIF